LPNDPASQSPLETRNQKLETVVMENLITRHRNVSVLVAVLFAQVLGLAVQVKSANANEGTRLIQLWTVSAITPFEKALVWLQNSTSGVWHNYFYLRGLRAENRALKDEIEQMRLEQVRLSEDAGQARRLQLLLGFKERFIAKTLAAQVIGTSGSEQSRAVYIDKGTRDGVQPDQAVITADGIVGKVLRVFDSSALVLLVNDQTSGVGVVLEKSRVQGVLRGAPNGELTIEKIMSDEALQPGERVLTSGGDQVFPKGLYIGTVTKVTPGSESFLNVRVKPGSNLSKLEEVLVVIRIENRLPASDEEGRPTRAVDILTQRLPSVPDKPPAETNQSAATGAAATPKPTGVPTSPVGRALNAGNANEPRKAGESAIRQGPNIQAASPKATGVGSGAATKKPGEGPAKTTAEPAVVKGGVLSPSSNALRAPAHAGVNGMAPKSATPTATTPGQGEVKPTALQDGPAKVGDSSVRPSAPKPQTPPTEAKPE
jgi:rod shape-determining protein MreC